MPIVIPCSCGKQLRVGDELFGKKVRCPACGEILRVDSSPASSPSKPSGKTNPGSAPPDSAEESPRARVKAEKPSGKRVRPEGEEPELEEDEGEEYEDRPRPSKRKRTRKGMSTGTWVGIGIGAVAVLLAICGGVGWLAYSALSGGVEKALTGGVARVRGAASRVQSMNNLKQIGLAFHNHVADRKGLAPVDLTSPDGKPLLSWRVALLPYIEEDPLFKQFKLNEPWDSPNNRPLADRMPKVFQLPEQPSPNMTHYKRFVGPGTMFPGGKQPVLFPRDFPKGTSNTLLIVEAANPSIWSKPEDILFDPNGDPLAQLLWTDGKSNALTADGSVHGINKNGNPQEIKNAVTKNGPPPNPGAW